MKQKNATPDLAQQEIIRQNGLSPNLWTVVKDLPHSMIIRSRITGEFRMINKEG